MSTATPTDPFCATADGERHAIYDELVVRGPVHRVPLPSGSQGYLITGFEAARAALTDPRVLKGGPGHGPFIAELPPDVAAAIDHHMLSLDPPDHTRLRRLVSAAFTRRRSEAMAPRIQELTDGLLDAMAGHDEVDLIAAFAYPLPITVICELLGIPESDRADFRAWTPPLVAGGSAGLQAYTAAATELVDYLRELLARKRREHQRGEPSDDLLSALVGVRDGGDRLTEDELTSMVYLLLLAGHETTVNLIGNGVRALLTHPEQLQLLHAAPERIGAAVEELLRFDGPVQSAIPAITAAPVELGGVPIPAGEIVVVSVLAANRDPARVSDANRFDLSRTESPHVAFGHGIHHCLGAPLARLEARIAIGSLLARYPRMRLAVPPAELRRLPGLVMNGLVALPVRPDPGE